MLRTRIRRTKYQTSKAKYAFRQRGPSQRSIAYLQFGQSWAMTGCIFRKTSDKLGILLVTSDSFPDANANTMKVLPIFLLLLSLALAKDAGKTPVETEAGVVLLENCLLKSELEHDVDEISEEMRAFGISHSTTKKYSNFVLHEAASPAKKSEKVMCIPPERVGEVGTRLGNIIWDFMEEKGPTKRRGDRPQFDFDPERDEDDTIAQAGKCCVCEDNEFPRRDGGAWGQGCWRGPCCPKLCRSLNQLQVAASDGVTGCCNRNYRPCLHKRGVSEGQRGGKDPLFT